MTTRSKIATAAWTAVTAMIAAVGLTGVALAQSPDESETAADRYVSTDQPMQAVLIEITEAALELCTEAKERGEVSNVPRCVVAVVNATAEASGDRALIEYVRDNRLMVRRLAIAD